VITTVHPSALLRAPDEEREAEIARFIDDLKQAKAALRDD